MGPKNEKPESASTASKDGHFWKSLLLGQFLALCITTTNACNGKLAEYDINIPTTQSLLNYLSLALIFGTYQILNNGFKMLTQNSFKMVLFYFILALVDVEGNYLIVKSYQYTSLLSVMLLDAWAVPCVMILSMYFLKARYSLMQIAGVFIAILGLVLLLTSDFLTGREVEGSDPIKGDLLCILGATLYAFSNTMEEMAVHKRSLSEVLFFMGFFGSFISSIQIYALEMHELTSTHSWNWIPVFLIILYDIALVSLYSLAAYLFKMAGATFFNLSILSADFFGLLIGIFLFKYTLHWLYFVAYPVVVIGLIVYSIFQPNSVPDNNII